MRVINRTFVYKKENYGLAFICYNDKCGYYYIIESSCQFDLERLAYHTKVSECPVCKLLTFKAHDVFIFDQDDEAFFSKNVNDLDKTLEESLI